MSSIRLFGVCVSVPPCKTTHVLCGGVEHRLRVGQIHVSACDLVCLKRASPFCVACAPIFDGSRIGTALVSFTCAAMLRMQTLVCTPVRCCDLSLSTSLGLHEMCEMASASSVPSETLLRLHFCNSLDGPVHACRRGRVDVMVRA